MSSVHGAVMVSFCMKVHELAALTGLVSNVKRPCLNDGIVVQTCTYPIS